ncbi:hypothetical protein BH10ACI1_BH10ACI1_26560 [soil metagenome]
MNATQEARLNMQRVVEEHLDENTTIIAAVPAFVTAFNKFKGFNAQIPTAVGAQETPRTGIAKDKSTSKRELVETALKLCKPARAYAADFGDNTLRDEMDYSFSDLNRLRDDQIAPRCQIIHNRAQENRAALADYGITAEKLADLQTKIDSYLAETTKPRTARADRSVKTDDLTELFRESKKVLEQMDDLIDNFAEEFPEFVKKYKKLRKTDKPPSRTTQLKGKITNKSDGTPINQAEITIVEPTKTAKTNSLGNYTIKPIAAGKHTIRVTKTGFTDVEVFDFNVKLGDITTLNVELVGN